MLASLRPLLLVPLGLLACTPEPKPEQHRESTPGLDEDKCDLEALAELATRLDAAEPDARVGLVAAGLLETCPKSLPPLTKFALRDIQGLAAAEPTAADDALLRAKRLACPKQDELTPTLEPLADAPAGERAGAIYDLCDYARYDLISREEQVALGIPGWLTWTTYALLLEQQVPAPTAKSIARALFLLEQARFPAVLITPLPTQRFAKVPTANQLPSGMVVSASTSELVCMEQPIASLDDGALKPSDAHNHLIAALFGVLQDEAEKSRAVAEALEQPWDARVLLAFDERIPFATVVDSLYTSARAGFTTFAFVVEPQFPVRRALLVAPPRYSARPVSPPLKVFITDEGFRVQLPNDHEPREIPKRDPKASTLDAWDHQRLRELAEDFKQLYPDASEAVVSTENHMPLGVLLATFGTLAGPRCDQVRRSDCLLPDLIVEAGAG